MNVFQDFGLKNTGSIIADLISMVLVLNLVLMVDLEQIDLLFVRF